MSAAHKRRHKHEEHEEHVNHERWLVSYADMLTVLMALFIVLFALSQVDQLKFAEFKSGFTKGTADSNQAVSGQSGILDVTNGNSAVEVTPYSTGEKMDTSTQQAQQILQSAATSQTQANLNAAQQEVQDYRAIEKKINDALTTKGDQDEVTYRITADGLVVGLVADNVFFASASDTIQPKGQEVVDTIAPILAQLSNDIAVQGHTNSLALSATGRFRDNWDLSAGRAMSVVTRFVGEGIAGSRLSGTGYADSRPLYPNDDPRAVTGNRRVDLVVASPSSDAVKALLPQVAATTATSGGPAELTGTTDTASATGTSGVGATSTASTTGSTASTTGTSATTAVATGITPDLASGVAH